jgi:hypothetical protein
LTDETTDAGTETTYKLTMFELGTGVTTLVGTYDGTSYEATTTADDSLGAVNTCDDGIPVAHEAGRTTGDEMLAGTKTVDGTKTNDLFGTVTIVDEAID